MADSPDIVQRITQNIQVFQRSKVQLGEPLDIVMPAARVGDIINHTSFGSALAGAIVGACVTAGIFALAGVAFAATGGLASMAIGAIATYALSGGIEKITNAVTSFVDEAIGGDPSGPIVLGSPNVLVNNKPLAIADLPLSVGCTRHFPPPKIAQGSETVFANNKPVSRKGDKTECSATIAEGSTDVFIGSGQGTYVEMKPEFNGFQRALLIGVEFIVPPTMLFSKGIGKAINQAGKLLATRGAYVGAAITGRAKNLFNKSVFKFRPKFSKDPIKTFNPQTANNIQKGNFGEIHSYKNMMIKRNNVGNPPRNYNLERIGNPPPRTLNDPTRHGIDGIYKNRTPPPSYVIDEAKYGTSELKKLKDGTKQMSDPWIKGRLSHLDLKEQVDIMKAIKNGNIDRVLSKVDSTGNVKTYRLDSKANNIGIWP